MIELLRNGEQHGAIDRRALECLLLCFAFAWIAALMLLPLALAYSRTPRPTGVCSGFLRGAGCGRHRRVCTIAVFTSACAVAYSVRRRSRVLLDHESVDWSSDHSQSMLKNLEAGANAESVVRSERPDADVAKFDHERLALGYA